MLHAPDHMLCFKIGFNTTEQECALPSRGELFVPETFSIFLCFQNKLSFLQIVLLLFAFLINYGYLLK